MSKVRVRKLPSTKAQGNVWDTGFLVELEIGKLNGLVDKSHLA